MPAADSKTVVVQVVLRITMTNKLAALTMLNSSSNHNSTSSTSSRVSSNLIVVASTAAAHCPCWC
jgi:hypothetical protein